MRRFLRNRGAAAGLAILGLVIAMAALAPVFYPASPWDMAGAPFRPPGARGFLLGSDMLGRDIASGIMHGARVSLLIGAGGRTGGGVDRREHRRDGRLLWRAYR